ncbi:MAG: hypothetical protein DRJ42_01400 [Deltaproteobacteria bacterium]|nr:MAG: hypothetical protein DRJ42_01400 [Deltaproteobacteria bacterium]
MLGLSKLLAMAATVGLAAAPALAQGGPEAQASTASRTSSLSWVRLPGAEDCATAPELARAVEARLGREVFVAPRNAELSVEGRVAPGDGGGFTATFAVATAGGEVLGERELGTESEDCSELTATVAFVVAVMIDPDAEERDAPEPDTAPSEAEPPVETDAAAAAAAGNGQEQNQEQNQEPRITDEAALSGWSGEIDGGLGVAVGLVPEPTIGGFGAIVIQTPWFIAAEFNASLYPYSPQSVGTGDVHWLTAFGGFLLCTAELGLGAIGLRGCAGGEIGFLRIGGVVDPPQDHIVGHVLVRARLAYRPWKGLVVWTRPTLAINPATDPYGYATSPTATAGYTPETVAGIFDLGVGWIFD